MPALLTLLGDSLKGCAAVLVAQWAGNSMAAAALAALAAVLGHMFPVYYRFRGGKGVATSLGVMTALLPWPTLGGIVIWVVAALALRYVSAASMLAALVVPLLALLRGDPAPLVLAAAAAAFLIIGAHRGNLQRLIRGTESRLW